MMYDAPMTRFEMTMTLFIVAVFWLMMGVIAIEATTGLPARIAIERWLAS